MEVPGLAPTSAQPWDLAQGRTGPALRRHIPRGRCPQPRGAAQSSRRHRGSAGTWCRSSRRGRGAPRRRRGARPRRTAPKLDREPEQVGGEVQSLLGRHAQRWRPTWRLSLASGGWRACRPARSPRGSGRARACKAATRGGAGIERSETRRRPAIRSRGAAVRAQRLAL